MDRRPKRILSASSLIVFLALAVCGATFARAQRPSGEPDVVRLRPNFYMIAGAGANIAVQIGSDGVVVVDSGNAAASHQVVAAIQKLTPLPIRYIINTNAEPDHVGGNAVLAKAGLTIFNNLVGNADMAKAMTNGGAASILAHDSVLRRMSAPTGKVSMFPIEAWPTEAFLEDRKYLRMNQEAIEIMRQPGAHSAADSFVLFRGSDVVVAGDVLDTRRFPVIDIANGGSIQGEIEALNRLIALAIPSGPFIYQGPGTYVIPGHGRVYEQLDVVDYRDMVVVVRDVIADMIKSGMTLEQVKAASPAKPFETRYSSKTGEWTTNDFVEAVYKSLVTKK